MKSDTLRATRFFNEMLAMNEIAEIAKNNIAPPDAVAEILWNRRFSDVYAAVLYENRYGSKDVAGIMAQAVRDFTEFANSVFERRNELPFQTPEEAESFVIWMSRHCHLYANADRDMLRASAMIDHALSVYLQFAAD